MNIIITAQVTYEITDVDSFGDALSIFQQCASSEAHQMEGVEYIGTKELFATEMTGQNSFDQSPKTWEINQV